MRTITRNGWCGTALDSFQQWTIHGSTRPEEPLQAGAIFSAFTNNAGGFVLFGQGVDRFGWEVVLLLVAAPVMALCAALVWRRANRKHAETERRLRASFKEISDLKTALDEHAIVAVTDPQGRITYANDKFCAISGYRREELLGQDHRIINSGHHPKEFMRDLWTTIARGQVWRGEFKNRAKDGSFYWVDTTIVPFLDESGKPRQHVSIRTEISKLKNIEAEVRKLNSELEQRVAERTADLQAANKELEAFSYSVSHDLRAPLRAVSGFTAILKEDHSAQLSEEARRLIERIHAGGQQMSRLINDLLKFSRLSRQALNRQDVNMASLVKSVWQEMEAEHKPREIEVRIGDLPPCSGDPALLKQVWANLISNAIKFTRGRDPAILEIGCNRNNGEVIYHICDNGAGFDMEHAGKLFDVFQRLHRPDEFEGSGVGLAIVQRIIHRHGGRVWAEAEVDRGATFHLTIGQKPVN